LHESIYIPLFSTLYSLSLQQTLPKQTHALVEPDLLPKLESLLLAQSSSFKGAVESAVSVAFLIPGGVEAE